MVYYYQRMRKFHLTYIDWTFLSFVNKFLFAELEYLVQFLVILHNHDNMCKVSEDVAVNYWNFWGLDVSDFVVYCGSRCIGHYNRKECWISQHYWFGDRCGSSVIRTNWWEKFIQKSAKTFTTPYSKAKYALNLVLKCTNLNRFVTKIATPPTLKCVRW